MSSKCGPGCWDSLHLMDRHGWQAEVAPKSSCGSRYPLPSCLPTAPGNCLLWLLLAHGQGTASAGAGQSQLSQPISALPHRVGCHLSPWPHAGGLHLRPSPPSAPCKAPLEHLGGPYTWTVPHFCSGSPAQGTELSSPPRLFCPWLLTNWVGSWSPCWS